MSLDVYLLGEPGVTPCACRCGNEHNAAAPVELYSANITHNLGKMASAAGIYEYLWRPEEIGATTAGQLVEPLRAGLAKMRADPARFRTLDAPNGWGTYDDFVPWIARYLDACEAHPEALVEVSR